MKSYPVVYLTGAPAAGKSSASRALRDVLSDIGVFEYGDQLRRYLAQREIGLVQEDLRSRSAGVATPQDIEAVDRLLEQFVAENRRTRPVVIDSHAVTKEQYGYRVTPFSIDEFARLGTTAIAVLYTPPEVTVERIRTAAGGRPLVTEWEAGLHTALQGSVAIAYSVSTRTPVHFIDGARPVTDVVASLVRLLTI